MDDPEVMDSFLADGAVQAFGSQLHIEGDCLVFDGWWKVAFRVAPRTFALRQDSPPDDTTTVDDLAARLAAQGLQEVPANPSLLVAITYSVIDLGLADWTIWSTDLATADADLATRAGVDTFFGDAPGEGTRETDFSAGIGGFRRLAGLAPLVVLCVGVDEAAATALSDALGNCHVELRALGAISPQDCGSLTPNLALVDATSDEGEGFLVALRGTECGRLLPLIALRESPSAAADVTLSPDEDPTAWAEHIHSLLP
ncbi:MAG: DUF4136 domain-containing protein [Acidimicrobiales bacterium]